MDLFVEPAYHVPQMPCSEGKGSVDPHPPGGTAAGEAGEHVMAVTTRLCQLLFRVAVVVTWDF